MIVIFLCNYELQDHISQKPYIQSYLFDDIYKNEGRKLRKYCRLEPLILVKLTLRYPFCYSGCGELDNECCQIIYADRE